MNLEHHEAARYTADAISGTAIIASLMGWLPPIAAILGIVWYVLLIIGWFEKRAHRNKHYKRRATDV